MKIFNLIINFFAFIFICWIMGFVWFVGLIPDRISKIDGVTDAIVVLTGGSGRIDAGFMLLAEGKAKKLFISGVGKNANLEDISKISTFHQNNKANLKSNIALGYEAYNTVENAIETMNWMRQNNVHSIILVTSNYHIPRSLAEFQLIMQDHKIIAYPVISNAIKIEKWWMFPGTMKLIFLEYNKFIYHKLKNSFLNSVFSNFLK